MNVGEKVWAIGGVTLDENNAEIPSDKIFELVPSSQTQAWTDSAEKALTRDALTWTESPLKLTVPRKNPQCAVATIGENTVVAVVGGFNETILNSTEFYTVGSDGGAFTASKFPKNKTLKW